jgi:hypothetical protein
MSTLQQRFLAALVARGESETKRLTSCIVVTRKAGGFYYLGRSGGLRLGATRGGSLPVSDKFKSQLLEEGEQK